MDFICERLWNWFFQAIVLFVLAVGGIVAAFRFDETSRLSRITVGLAGLLSGICSVVAWVLFCISIVLNIIVWAKAL